MVHTPSTQLGRSWGSVWLEFFTFLYNFFSRWPRGTKVRSAEAPEAGARRRWPRRETKTASQKNARKNSLLEKRLDEERARLEGSRWVPWNRKGTWCSRALRGTHLEGSTRPRRLSLFHHTKKGEFFFPWSYGHARLGKSGSSVLVPILDTPTFFPKP